MLTTSGMNSPPAKSCPFCHLDPRRILAEDELVVVYKDGFPVSQGHTVIIPRRHVATLFEASEAEQAALLKAVAQAKDILDKHYQPRSGWRADRAAFAYSFDPALPGRQGRPARRGAVGVA